MFKQVGKINSKLKLAAFSLAGSYFIANSLINNEIINTSFKIALLFSFLTVYLVLNLIFLFLAQRASSSEITTKQNSSLSFKVKQKTDAKNSSCKKKNLSQKSSITGTVDQEMKL